MREGGKQCLQILIWLKQHYVTEALDISNPHASSLMHESRSLLNGASHRRASYTEPYSRSLIYKASCMESHAQNLIIGAPYREPHTQSLEHKTSCTELHTRNLMHGALCTEAYAESLMHRAAHPHAYTHTQLQEAGMSHSHLGDGQDSWNAAVSPRLGLSGADACARWVV